MPLYLVRWSQRDAAVIVARNPGALLQHLDASDECSWDVYDGPFYLNVDLSRGIARVSDESIQAMRQSATGVTPLRPEFDGDGSDDGLDDGLEQDIASVLTMAREDWINSLDTDALRDNLRHTLRRLDECESMLPAESYAHG